MQLALLSLARRGLGPMTERSVPAAIRAARCFGSTALETFLEDRVGDAKTRYDEANQPGVSATAFRDAKHELGRAQSQLSVLDRHGLLGGRTPKTWPTSVDAALSDLEHLEQTIAGADNEPQLWSDLSDLRETVQWRVQLEDGNFVTASAAPQSPRRVATAVVATPHRDEQRRSYSTGAARTSGSTLNLADLSDAALRKELAQAVTAAQRVYARNHEAFLSDPDPKNYAGSSRQGAHLRRYGDALEKLKAVQGEFYDRGLHRLPTFGDSGSYVHSSSWRGPFNLHVRPMSTHASATVTEEVEAEADAARDAAIQELEAAIAEEQKILSESHDANRSSLYPESPLHMRHVHELQEARQRIAAARESLGGSAPKPFSTGEQRRYMSSAPSSADSVPSASGPLGKYQIRRTATTTDDTDDLGVEDLKASIPSPLATARSRQHSSDDRRLPHGDENEWNGNGHLG